MNVLEWLRDRVPEGKLSSTGWYNFPCPSPRHPDNSPSFGFDLDGMEGKCHGCGMKVDLAQLIRLLDGVSHMQALIRARNAFVPEIEHQEKAPSIERKFELHPYWESRGINIVSVIKYGLTYDKERDAMVIPVHDQKGKFAGNIFRNMKPGVARYINEGFEKAQHLWGLHHLDRPLTKVCVTEGVVDAILLNQLGYPTVATIGAGLSRTQKTLLENSAESICFVIDNDDPGLRMADYAASLRHSVGLVPVDYKDVGEQMQAEGTVTIEEVSALKWRIWSKQRATG